MTIRCAWCGVDPLYVAYHDEEWGVAVHDDRALFEMLCLEGAQAGLSWITILRKRASYRRAFRDFDPHAVARFRERDIERLLGDPGIVRNRLKVESVVRNAKGSARNPGAARHARPLPVALCRRIGRGKTPGIRCGTFRPEQKCLTA